MLWPLPFEVAGQDEIVPQTYGTSQIVLQIPAPSFAPVDGGNLLKNVFNLYYYRDDLGFLDTGVMFPTGARLEAMDFYYLDADPISDCAAILYAVEGTTTISTTLVAQVSSTAGAAASMWLPFPSNTRVNNTNKQYFVRVHNTSLQRQFRAVAFRYSLQVSPAPATATFADVPTDHPFFQFIEALAASGITAGCSASPPMYCPDATLTRGQMAVFLARALGLHWAP